MKSLVNLRMAKNVEDILSKILVWTIREMISLGNLSMDKNVEGHAYVNLWMDKNVEDILSKS